MKSNNHKFLITGTSSGLGKFLHQNLENSVAFQRDNKEIPSADVIIHCAFNSVGNVKSSEFEEYLNDNFFLTEFLTSLPHKKFIYISSIDIYPKNLELAQENSDFSINDIESQYGRMKLIAENLVKKNCQNFLILRPSAMLGVNSRDNSLSKILKNITNQLTLSEQSSFNYILHEQVHDFIEKAVESDITGIFNLSSSKNISLDEVVKKYGKSPIKFGNFTYKTPTLDNQKAVSISESFKKTSVENIEKFREMISSKN